MAECEKSGSGGSIAKSFDQYEYVAVLTPGATLLFGLMLIWPDRNQLLTNHEVGLGALGIFLLAAYVVGHILRALGDILEACLWRLFGGMPTDWVLVSGQELLDAADQTELQRRIQILSSSANTLNDYAGKRKEWKLVIRRMNAAVFRGGGGARVDAFNRTYGLMIGVTVALLVLGVVQLFGLFWYGGTKHQMLYCALTFASALLTLIRAYCFGVHYGRELFAQFLQLPETTLTA
jgi:hypothetical protein